MGSIIFFRITKKFPAANRELFSINQNLPVGIQQTAS